MNLKVVAEGVEIEEQLSILKDMQCDYIQGYYFSRPLPVSEVEGLMIKRDV
jgi:EAL domain-containing protein (putative c-di-GMP-specific phosphodiesterase class I)